MSSLLLISFELIFFNGKSSVGESSILANYKLLKISTQSLWLEYNKAHIPCHSIQLYASTRGNLFCFDTFVVTCTKLGSACCLGLAPSVWYLCCSCCCPLAQSMRQTYTIIHVVYFTSIDLSSNPPFHCVDIVLLDNLLEVTGSVFSWPLSQSCYYILNLLCIITDFVIETNSDMPSLLSTKTYLTKTLPIN
jgi:hypothetical protein